MGQHRGCLDKTHGTGAFRCGGAQSRAGKTSG
jgi:hypothetical protein